MLNQPVETHDEKKRKIKRHYYIDIEKALGGPEQYEEAIVGVEADRTLRVNFGRDIKLEILDSGQGVPVLPFPMQPDTQLGRGGGRGVERLRPEPVLRRDMQFRKAVLAEFRNYDIPVIELTKDNRKEAVCLVFEKVNTGGVPLGLRVAHRYLRSGRRRGR